MLFKCIFFLPFDDSFVANFALFRGAFIGWHVGASKALLRNKQLSEHNKERKFSIAVHCWRGEKKYSVFNQYSFELDAVRVVA